MPFTPYHFGPNGLIGFIFRKWIDLPIIVMANVLVDVEVLYAVGLPHRHWHLHSLLGGLIAGALFGLLIYYLKPIRLFLQWIMSLLKIPYKPSLWKMALSGILGIWLHVIVDSLYHYDVQMFWPYKGNPLWNLFTRPDIDAAQEYIKLICLALLVLACVLYAVCILCRYTKKNR